VAILKSFFTKETLCSKTATHNSSTRDMRQ